MDHKDDKLASRDIKTNNINNVKVNITIMIDIIIILDVALVTEVSSPIPRIII